MVQVEKTTGALLSLIAIGSYQCLIHTTLCALFNERHNWFFEVVLISVIMLSVPF